MWAVALSEKREEVSAITLTSFFSSSRSPPRQNRGESVRRRELPAASGLAWMVAVLGGPQIQSEFLTCGTLPGLKRHFEYAFRAAPSSSLPVL